MICASLCLTFATQPIHDEVMCPQFLLLTTAAAVLSEAGICIWALYRTQHSLMSHHYR
jgi:hypothetical protein